MLTILLVPSCRRRYKSLIFNQYKHSPNNKNGKFRREKMRYFSGLCTFLCTFILRLDSTKIDKMRCWNFWKVKSGLRSTLGITPNTLPPRKRGILAFYRYIIKISTKCVWFCVRLSNTFRAYKNDDKELRPQKTEELVQIYTFCASYATTERRKWLPETWYFNLPILTLYIKCSSMTFCFTRLNLGVIAYIWDTILHFRRGPMPSITWRIKET